MRKVNQRAHSTRPIQRAMNKGRYSHSSGASQLPHSHRRKGKTNSLVRSPEEEWGLLLNGEQRQWFTEIGEKHLKRDLMLRNQAVCVAMQWAAPYLSCTNWWQHLPPYPRVALTALATAQLSSKEQPTRPSVRHVLLSYTGSTRNTELDHHK